MITQRAAHLAEKSRVQQEPHGLGRLLGQQFVPQVIHDEPVVPPWTASRLTGGVGCSPDRERGQVHPCWPAFGTPDNGTYLLIGADHTCPGENLARLLLGERQVLRAELYESALTGKLTETQAEP